MRFFQGGKVPGESGAIRLLFGGATEDGTLIDGDMDLAPGGDLFGTPYAQVLAELDENGYIDIDDDQIPDDDAE